MDRFCFIINYLTEGTKNPYKPSGQEKNGDSTVKRTYQPSKIVRKRRHGYRKRQMTVGGRKVLKNRRTQGRKRLSA